MDSTVTDICITDSMAFSGLVITTRIPEYTDEQFYADLRKSKKKLDRLERRALKDHAKGKTRRFPV